VENVLVMYPYILQRLFIRQVAVVDGMLMPQVARKVRSLNISKVTSELGFIGRSEKSIYVVEQFLSKLLRTRRSIPPLFKTVTAHCDIS